MNTNGNNRILKLQEKNKDIDEKIEKLKLQKRENLKQIAFLQQEGLYLSLIHI